MKRRLTCCVECVFLLFQEGIAIESNHFIRNPVCSQKVAHCFCDKQDDLDKVWVNETSPYRSGSPTIVGRMYVKAPVSSNIITTTDTVRRITPLSNVGVTCAWVTKRKTLPQCRCCAQERIRSRRDTRDIRLADCKYSRCGICTKRRCSVSNRIPGVYNIGTYRYKAFTIIPIILPKVAPMAIDGTKIPAGTFEPYEIITSTIRIIVARNNELTILH